MTGRCPGGRHALARQPRRRVPQLLLAVWLAGVAAWLVWQLQQVAWPLVGDSVRAYPAHTLLKAALLAVLSLLLYSSFDLLGRHVTGHQLATAQVMRVTFISHVFNLNLGALVGGVALRYRLYMRLGLGPAEVTQVLALSVLTNWLGCALLAGCLLILWPPALPASWAMGRSGLQALGAGLLAVGLIWLWCCQYGQRRAWRLGKMVLILPSGGTALLQGLLGLSHWLVLGSLLHELMPASLGFATVTSVLLLAAFAGVLTHVPAGLGVLEGVFLGVLSEQAPAHGIWAALLTYRLIYYLAPLSLAVLLYLQTEWQARNR